MASETKGIPCAKDNWTLVADGKANVLIRPRNNGVIRIFIGTAAPVVDVADYVTIVGGDAPFSASNLVTGDKVYVMAKGNDNIVEVARG